MVALFICCTYSVGGIHVLKILDGTWWNWFYVKGTSVALSIFICSWCHVCKGMRKMNRANQNWNGQSRDWHVMVKFRFALYWRFKREVDLYFYLFMSCTLSLELKLLQKCNLQGWFQNTNMEILCHLKQSKYRGGIGANSS